MPRLAMALDSWLQEAMSTAGDGLLVKAAAAGILLSYVFGWRCSTAAALRVADCTFLEH